MTPYAASPSAPQYKFSDDSQIGRVAAGTGNESNYRFFEIQPIKWIVLNYNKGFDESSNIKDGLSVGTMKRYELLANEVLIGGVAPDNILWENNMINYYMNNYMSDKMFSSSEQQLVELAAIYNNTNEADSNLMSTGSNSNYPVVGSNPATQILYLLSRYEMENENSLYITNGVFGTNNVGNNSKRIVYASDYAKAHHQGLNTDIGKAHCWLRTTSDTKIYYNTSDGNIVSYQANYASIGTRPAITNKKPSKLLIYLLDYFTGYKISLSLILMFLS